MKRAVIVWSSVLVLGLSSVGCGNKKNPAGLKDFNVGVQNGRLNLSFVSTVAQWDVGATVPVPHLGDATLSIQPDVLSDGVIFGFSASINEILEKGLDFQVSGLPDGRAIPGIAGGTMHRNDVEVKSGYTVSMYFSEDAFGFYAPLPIKKKELVRFMSKPFKFWIADPKGNRIGKGYVMPPTAKDGSGAGVMILLPFLGSSPDVEP